MEDEQRRGEYAISTDRARIDLEMVAGFLSRSYWASARSLKAIETSIANSMCFGVYRSGDGVQVGIARVITDFATRAYLVDVFIDESHRGRGLSVWLMGVITSHPKLRDVEKWVLGTRDAHTLYEKFGWRPLEHPELMMERTRQPLEAAKGESR